VELPGFFACYKHSAQSTKQMITLHMA